MWKVFRAIWFIPRFSRKAWSTSRENFPCLSGIPGLLFGIADDSFGRGGGALGIFSYFWGLNNLHILMGRIIEICANSALSCVEAEAGGATRVELCAGIPEGGTTPSYGEIKMAQALTSKIQINVIIRPRGGDFLYTEAEVEAMLLDIELCKRLKVHGVVFGCLTKEGDIDVPLMRRLIEAAKPLSGHLPPGVRRMPGSVCRLGAADRVRLRPDPDLRTAVGCRERYPPDRRVGAPG